MSKPIVIGISGGSASGKTSISQIIVDRFNDRNSVVTIKMDDYYKDQSEKTLEERTKTNYDHPSAFDIDLFIQHIDELCSGKEILKPTYDFTTHNRSSVTEIVKPADVVILEGLFILEEEEIRKRCNIKLFVDAENDLRFIRRLKRDYLERGRSVESVCQQYENTVKIMHDLFVEPSKKYADIIIPYGSSNRVAVDLIITKVDSIIREHKLSNN